ncbi:MAG: YceI family protein [Candidatus Kapabacteria bacterium]|nr:YceI family protein [Candidatus Kapabacteria bacterium]
MEYTMTTWTVDQAHSEAHFKVKHLMINNVTGEFGSFRVNVESETDNFAGAQIDFEADVSSINTKNEMRDNHLKSDDFFNAEKFPVMSFHGKGITKVKGSEYLLVGDLTIRDVTKEISLDVENGGLMTDFYGTTKAGFEITGNISRKDFGLLWNGVTETGGIVVSDSVKLQLNIQLQKQA